MKKAMKKLVAAALAALVTTTALTGCKNNKTDNTTENPFATLPENTTASTESNSDSTESTSDSSSENTENPPVVEMKGFNVLTGEPIQNNVSSTRPVAIVVDNSPYAASTQTGLDQADILYEALVTSGTTRFVMVSADYTLLDKVSNIREGVAFHMDFAAYHNAVLVCHGGLNTAEKNFVTLAAERYGSEYGFVNTSVERYFSWKEDGEKYGTIEKADRKDLTNNTVFKPSAMTALLGSESSKFIGQGKGTLMGEPKGGLGFVEYGTKKDLSGASSATEISLNFKAQGSLGVNKIVEYTYNAEKGKYMRSQANLNKEIVAHVDSQTGEQLGFTNVIALFTTVEALDTGDQYTPTVASFNNVTENGLGYYFTDGKVIQIKWESNGTDLKLMEAADGTDLLLNTGNTCISFLDQSYLNGVQFWQ